MGGARAVPIVRQSALTECGLACVAMIAGFLGSGADIVQL
ncbi:MAG: peptidase C39, partial [Proteobacteria bacterium]|nr:peptidase C39 [Pseudomonadota bacterium]